WHALKRQKYQSKSNQDYNNDFNLYCWHALKRQKYQSKSNQDYNNDFNLYCWHALKGQKLLAQGIALGIMAISKAPCKGKSFINCLEF
ncbi:hypothetical protein F7D20_11505, partial [Prevotella copri]|nr:hypothetical protein [Segatella copri]